MTYREWNYSLTWKAPGLIDFRSLFIDVFKRSSQKSVFLHFCCTLYWASFLSVSVLALSSKQDYVLEVLISVLGYQHFFFPPVFSAKIPSLDIIDFYWIASPSLIQSLWPGSFIRQMWLMCLNRLSLWAMILQSKIFCRAKSRCS